jgi:hypothetical protein
VLIQIAWVSFREFLPFHDFVYLVMLGGLKFGGSPQHEPLGGRHDMFLLERAWHYRSGYYINDAAAYLMICNQRRF